MRSLIYVAIATVLLSCANTEKNLPLSFDFGKTENGSYKNDYFDLQILFNPSWFVQDKQQMNDLVDLGNDLVVGDNENLESIVEASHVNTAYLLAVFKHEVGSPVESNPSFLAVAENIKSSPGIKNGKDYLFHAKNLLQQSEMQYSFEKEVYEKKIGSSTFHVLEAQLSIFGDTVTQEYISTVSKGFTLSFIASYSNEEEKSELYRILDSIKI